LQVAVQRTGIQRVRLKRGGSDDDFKSNGRAMH
jgi:hypothetical protein